MKHLKREKGESELNKHYFFHILELGIIVSLLCYAIFFGKTQAQSLEDPPSFVGETANVEDVINDLQNLGCALHNLTEASSNLHLQRYDDFRKIAYNSKIVFLNYRILFYFPMGKPPVEYLEGLRLYTIYNGIIIECELTF